MTEVACFVGACVGARAEPGRVRGRARALAMVAGDERDQPSQAHERAIMSKQSAGILLYRRRGDGIEFLLVHPGGPFWAKKDEGAWSIPKGEHEPGEDALEAALREFEEEIGTRPAGDVVPLTPIRQKAGKVVAAWGLEGDVDATAIRSNTFTMEWPPRSGRTQTFPEIDRAAWFTLERARSRINAAQLPLLEELARMLSQ